MKYIIMLSLCLLGFKNTLVEPMFKPGECALFIDQPGVPDKSMLVKVEGFKNGHYLYRWWTFQNEWALETNKGVGKQILFERLFVSVKCPK